MALEDPGGLFMPGRFTDLTDTKQLGILNVLLSDILDRLTSPGIIDAVKIEQIVKTADQVVNNSTTLVDDDDLKFQIGVREKVLVQVYVLYDGPNEADLKCGWTVPSGTTGETYCHSLATDSPAGIEGNFRTDRSTSVSGTLDLGTGDVGNRLLGFITATLTGGTTAGTVNFQWAQNTATAQDNKVATGSYLLVYHLKD